MSSHLVCAIDDSVDLHRIPPQLPPFSSQKVLVYFIPWTRTLIVLLPFTTLFQFRYMVFGMGS